METKLDIEELSEQVLDRLSDEPDNKLRSIQLECPCGKRVYLTLVGKTLVHIRTLSSSMELRVRTSVPLTVECGNNFGIHLIHIKHGKQIVANLYE